MAEMIGNVYKVQLFDLKAKGKQKSRITLVKGLVGKKLPDFEEVQRAILDTLAKFDGLVIIRKTKKNGTAKTTN